MPVSPQPDTDHSSDDRVGGDDVEADKGEERALQPGLGTTRGGSESSASRGRLEPGDDDVEEEAQPNKPIAKPNVPSREEMEEHRANWCPHCVEGAGREWPHRTRTQERTVPVISCDYFFITPKGVFAREEVSDDERAVALKVVVATCGVTKSLFAHAVPRKGLDSDGSL